MERIRTDLNRLDPASQRRADLIHLIGDIARLNNHLVTSANLPNTVHAALLVPPSQIPSVVQDTIPLTYAQQSFNGYSNFLGNNIAGFTNLTPSSLGHYIQNLLPIALPFNGNVTAARQFVTNHTPNVLYRATENRSTYPVLAVSLLMQHRLLKQLLYLFTAVGSSSPNNVIQFDFGSMLSTLLTPNDVLSIGQPMSYAQQFPGNFPLTSPSDPVQLPSLINLFVQCQNFDFLANFFYILSQLVNFYNAGTGFTVQFHILSRRISSVSNEETIFRFDNSQTHTQPLVCDSTLSPTQIRDYLLHRVFGIFIERDGSDFVAAEDRFVILGWTVVLNPSPILGGLQLTGQSLHGSITTLLHNINAYAIPTSLWKDLSSLAVPISSTYTNHCIVEAYTYLRMYQTDTVNATTSKKEMKAIYNSWVEGLDMSLFDDTNLYEAFVVLMNFDLQFWDQGDESGMVTLHFFASQGRAPLHPSMRIRYNSEIDELEYELPVTGESTFDDDSEHQYCLVYHNGHLLLSTFGQFMSVIDSSQSYYKRMLKISDERASKEFTLKPIDINKVRSKHRKFFERVQQNPLIASNPLSRLDGIVIPDLNLCKYASDLETGTCHLCSASGTVFIQEAFSAGISWGTTKEEGACFVGQECAHTRRDSSFDTYTGCITQMLRFMFQRWGFYHAETPNHHPPAHVVKRYVSFFNGARFDLFFVREVLMFWNYPVEIITLHDDIIQMTCGNFVFQDLNRIYPGTLAACYKTAVTVEQSEPHMLQPPVLGKWEHFPYMLISSEHDLDAQYDLNTLPVNIWGDKAVHADKEKNVQWWKEHVNNEGMYLPRQHLVDYCMDDIYILFFILHVHSFYVAQGTLNERDFNANAAPTASGFAMQIFRQSFLERDISAPPNFALDWTNPFNSQQPVMFSHVIDCAKKGGIVDAERHEPNNPTLIVEERDVNSEYPSVYVKEDLPIKPTSVDNFQSSPFRIQACDVVRTDLYWCSIQYPPDKCGIPQKIGGYFLAMNFLEHAYKDPHLDNRTTFNMIWGIELQQAMEEHGDAVIVMVYGIIHFETYPLLRKYGEALYAMRLASKTALDKTKWKLCLNSIYGKFGELFKSSCVFIYNAMDLVMLSEKYVITNVLTMSGPNGKLIYLVYYVDYSKAHIGQFTYIASFITAGGRSLVLSLRADWLKTYNPLGELNITLYMDTDSCKGTEIARTEANEWFFVKWEHPTELGKCKIDKRLAVFVAFNKKSCVGVLVSEKEVQVLKRANLLESKELHLQALANGEIMITQKGIPKQVRDKSSYEIFSAWYSEERKPLTFQMPTTFDRSLHNGVTISKSLRSRSMSFINRGRKLGPRGDGALLPYDNVAAFLLSLKSDPEVPVQDFNISIVESDNE